MSEYKPPSWAGKPPPGLHLDVVKNGTVLQKLLIDEKSYYLFGRNRDACDFSLEHQSVSRLHAALVYHKHLDRPFLVDLGSTHGTFVGSIRLEHNKPQQIPIDSTISFGASTRTYTLRKRPQAVSTVAQDSGMGDGESLSGLLGLPESETEMDDLTQYNTALNKQVTAVGITDEDRSRRRKKRLSGSVDFNSEIEVINPEDIDPNVGRFRNMVQSSFIPSSKRQKTDREATPTSPSELISPTDKHKQFVALPKPSLYSNLPGVEPAPKAEPPSPSFMSRTVTAAPPVQVPRQKPHGSAPLGGMARGGRGAPVVMQNQSPVPLMPAAFSSEPQKKKYAKEAWPGKKPTPMMLL